MRATPDTIAARPSGADTSAVYLKPRVLIVLFLGFSAGLPLALSGSTLLVWMREAGVDLGTIGLFALVGTPYTIKFLWAPVVDALDIPGLSALLGRRRGWLVFSQLLLIAAIAFLAFCDPCARPAGRARRAAGGDRVRHAGYRHRRLPHRDPPENEQAAGMASYAAYRSACWPHRGALFLVSGFEASARQSAA
jgi:PAT family beta-lactamase induction signal transducer AmpG